MIDQKISQLNELTLIDGFSDSLVSVDTIINRNYKFLPRNIPITFSEKNQTFPFVVAANTDPQPLNIQNLTSVPSLFFENDPKDYYYVGTNVTGIDNNAFQSFGTSFIQGSVILTNNIIGIGNSAFFSQQYLTGINIPNSVTSIGSNAFQNSGLTSITIPNNVNSIGNFAFYQCTDLASVTLPTNVDFTTIGTSAFRQTSITSITIPDSVTSIGLRSFQSCTSLTSITIPDSVTSIGGSAFQSCTGLTSVTLPNNVNFTSIGSYTFFGCNNAALTSITIPDSVEIIGNGAFYFCTGLTSITIGNSVTSIEYRAFYQCISLTSIIIPDSLASFGTNALAQCTNLSSITSLAVAAPTLGTNVFINTALTKIIVPVGSAQDYRDKGDGTTYGGLTIQEAGA